MNARLLLPVALVVLFSPAVFAQDYEIKLSRPEKAGDEFKLDVNGKQTKDMTVTSNGNPVKNDKSDVTVKCTGVLKVIEVDAKGQPTKTSLTIDKFTKTEGDKESEVLPKDTVVTSSKVDKKPVHMVNGQAVDHEVSELLTMVVSLSSGTDDDDDTIFGTKERKKKGDNWDINADQAVKSFEESVGGKLENFTGKATLEDVIGDTLKIKAHFTTNFQPPLPPGFVVDSSSMEASFGGIFPVDTTKDRPEESLKIDFSFAGHADAPSGEKIELKLKGEEESVRKMTRLK